mmetsp:Transcript_26370/g.63717  ORF Transcript_26370/g.63717 Transcript_26370/m.63717 type:complete len:122 (-) Transcript_26370:685-1050(-)
MRAAITDAMRLGMEGARSNSASCAIKLMTTPPVLGISGRDGQSEETPLPRLCSAAESYHQMQRARAFDQQLCLWETFQILLIWHRNHGGCGLETSVKAPPVARPTCAAPDDELCPTVQRYS